MKSTSQLQEINHYQDQDFPVNVYYSDIHSMQPPGRWLRDFHWHDELQFTLVLSGTLTMQVDNLSLPGQAGDLIFVNTSLIHAVTQMSEDGSYASLNFPYRLLAFFPGSRMGSGLQSCPIRRVEILRFLLFTRIQNGKKS